ncbi:hypothetical protein E2C01_046889 [Portunus trituberculatus]|uniref:Uncharacterized protein n=1 Tax=Portunus trituberculatus TaxID=210409 RepID=A0A5B7G6A6_PORTR|nr:hypothetical protein [Portunus trituberculatus]
MVLGRCRSRQVWRLRRREKRRTKSWCRCGISSNNRCGDVVLHLHATPAPATRLRILPTTSPPPRFLLISRHLYRAPRTTTLLPDIVSPNFLSFPAQVRHCPLLSVFFRCTAKNTLRFLSATIPSASRYSPMSLLDSVSSTHFPYHHSLLTA